MADNNMLSGLIMEGSTFEGKLTFVNKMRIDGAFKGEIVSDSRLIVGKNASIDASVRVKEVVVMGELRGSVSDCDFLQIQEGGKVIAELKVKTLDIKPGAVFDGQCVMITENKDEKIKPTGSKSSK